MLLIFELAMLLQLSLLTIIHFVKYYLGDVLTCEITAENFGFYDIWIKSSLPNYILKYVPLSFIRV